jgi:ribosome maturation factor RimP
LSGSNVRVGGKTSSRAGGSTQRHESAPSVPAGPRLGWREAIAATVTGLGFELVDVERAQRGLLRVFIDRIPGRSYSLPGEFITVDDCEQVTRQLQYALEVEGLEYARLEVSSPGLDRPLKSEADFERFAGQAVHVLLKAPFQGRKTWQGVLGRSEDGAAWSLQFKIGKTEQVLGLKFEEVREARLVPVVDFKGRKSKDGGQAGVADGAAPGTDGG